MSRKQLDAQFLRWPEPSDAQFPLAEHRNITGNHAQVAVPQSGLELQGPALQFRPGLLATLSVQAAGFPLWEFLSIPSIQAAVHKSGFSVRSASMDLLRPGLTESLEAALCLGFSS